MTFFLHCHPERREAKPNGVEGPHTRWQRRWLRKLFHDALAENVSTVVASQADLGCFDSTAACAALPLSMTGVEKINKVTNWSAAKDLLFAGDPVTDVLDGHFLKVNNYA